ncbi:MAG: CpaF family protein [Clostridiales Family XIII bacterium]|jgi:pilus assembly protein CpaF|nr:CpaF family protein [Clostridiales Family XIII bacterium]
MYDTPHNERYDMSHNERYDMLHNEQYDMLHNERYDMLRDEQYDTLRDERCDIPRDEQYDTPRDERHDTPRDERYDAAVATLTAEVRKYIRTCGGEVLDDEVMGRIEEEAIHGAACAGLTVMDRVKAADTVFCRTRRDLSVLQPLADDPAVSEIMVNGRDDVFVERKGHIERTDIRFEHVDELEELIRRIAARVHREINELSPILDARLEDGSRVNAIYKNVALNGPILTIRRFPETGIRMADLLSFGSITQEAAEFLSVLVTCAYNIFISGGTSSGKTTFLNALAGFIPSDERIITIEDSAELQIRGIDNLVRMECRSANAQDRGAVNMRQLIRASLRMRPNRIIVGEVRGEEVLDMIQAMNTGHSGSLSTGHGNSPRGMLYRLEAMFLQAADFPIAAIRRQITEGIDIMVHLGRLPGGARTVLDISEITGMKDGEIELNPLFQYATERGLERTENKLMDRSKLQIKGVRLQ